jgi:hypothetical protein
VSRTKSGRSSGPKPPEPRDLDFDPKARPSGGGLEVEAGASGDPVAGGERHPEKAWGIELGQLERGLDTRAVEAPHLVALMADGASGPAVRWPASITPGAHSG